MRCSPWTELCDASHCSRLCASRELYKHTYVVAGWSWKRGMQKIEARCRRKSPAPTVALFSPDQLLSPHRSGTSQTWAALHA